MTATQELLRLLGRPESVQGTGTDASWKAFERKLGTSLPRDYREVIAAFGAGLIYGFLRVMSPFSIVSVLNLEQFICSDCELQARGLARERKEDAYKYYPIFPGLLPWGNDVDSNTYYWHTKGNPDEWRVVVLDRDGDHFPVDKTMSAFLVAMIEGKLRDRGLKELSGVLREWAKNKLPYEVVRLPFVTPLEYMFTKRKPT